MFLEITQSTTIVLFILTIIITLTFTFFLYSRVRRERIRYKEEKSISLDGLLSKSAITSQINTYLTRITTDVNFSLLLIDFDEYLTISDAFGKKETDRALEKVVFRIVQELPKRVQIASFGGTQFLVFMKSDYDRFQCIELAKNLLEIIRRPVKIYRETNVNFYASIGVCFYPKHGLKFKQLLNSLNIALHNAQRTGGNKYVIYSSNMNNTGEKIEFHYEIKEAIEKKEFILNYQPIINIKDNDIYGVESFVRWNHPKHGILSPVQFLNIMEQSGEITWIGTWGLESLIKEYFDFLRLYPEKKLIFTMNVSPKQMMDDRIADEFGKIIRKYRMPAEQITLEVEDFSNFQKNNMIVQNIMRLRKLGFKIATNGINLDYSTLSTLDTMPIDMIKLDNHFFYQEKESFMKDKLADLIVDFVNKHQKIIIAEGVETLDMLESIKGYGIDLIQGYYFSKPIVSLELQDYIKNKSWTEEKPESSAEN